MKPAVRDQDGDFAGWLGAVAAVTDELLDPARSDPAQF
jgi:hypothetical protein